MTDIERVDIIDYRALGRKIIGWSKNARSRPKDLVEFEKQLKQVVFTWLPADRRLETNSLDELISKTTNQWNERQRLRKLNLDRLNGRIAAIEVVRPRSRKAHFYQVRTGLRRL